MTVLDAVCSQIRLGRDLFTVGVERGFYAKVSRLGESWFELDLHFLSLGGGEIALGWWFEECLVPYLQNTDKLASVKSISIVTGYGKTRTRGRRHGDDGMRKRCKAMLSFMNIKEHDQSNLGRIHVDKESLIEEVRKNGAFPHFCLLVSRNKSLTHKFIFLPCRRGKDHFRFRRLPALERNGDNGQRDPRHTSKNSSTVYSFCLGIRSTSVYTY